jgi:hypothetical protein
VLPAAARSWTTAAWLDKPSTREVGAEPTAPSTRRRPAGAETTTALNKTREVLIWALTSGKFAPAEKEHYESGCAAKYMLAAGPGAMK